MRLYEPGEQVRLPDDSIATVVERHDEKYELPPGQMLGAEEGEEWKGDSATSTLGGEAWYDVKTKDGKIIQVQDRDVRNPPKDAAPAPEMKAKAPAPKPSSKLKRR